MLPVYAGEMAGKCLGVDVAAFDSDGNEVVGELGELVIRQPMPSMPVKFWNDEDGSRYRAAYFGVYPGVWRHGDWIMFTERGTSIITGRSDATLNRGGVRLGTSELYGVVEEFDEVLDALVVHLEATDELLLFVVLRDGVELDDGLKRSISDALRSGLSPRHKPDDIVAVPAIPRTMTGKKLELPVKRILTGTPVAEVVSKRRAGRPRLDRGVRRLRRAAAVAHPSPFSVHARARAVRSAPSSAGSASSTGGDRVTPPPGRGRRRGRRRRARRRASGSGRRP